MWMHLDKKVSSETTAQSHKLNDIPDHSTSFRENSVSEHPPKSLCSQCQHMADAFYPLVCRRFGYSAYDIHWDEARSWLCRRHKKNFFISSSRRRENLHRNEEDNVEQSNCCLRFFQWARSAHALLHSCLFHLLLLSTRLSICKFTLCYMWLYYAISPAECCW